jgi:proline iminopeptidase
MPPKPISEPRVAGWTQTTAVPLAWMEYGPAHAPPLLLLHGGPGADHRYLLPQMLRLAAQHDVLFYDQRGGGAPGRAPQSDPGPVTWRTQVEDLSAVVRERLRDAPPTIVGYSWGGLLALLYLIESARDPDAAPIPPERLVLIAPAPATRAERAEFEAELARRQAATVGPRTALTASGLRERDPGAYAQQAFELSVSGYFADPARAHDLTPFRIVGRTQGSVWASLGAYDLYPALRTLADAGRVPPTLIVHGRNDPIPLAASERLAHTLGATLVVLDRCGHVPYVEQPDALFGAIDNFLAATGAGAAAPSVATGGTL